MKKLTVGITGMVGFVGSHLHDRLSREENILTPPFEDDFFANQEMLKKYFARCDTIVHLAAMNRGDDDEIYNTNVELVNKLVSTLEQINAKSHIIFSSSTQIDRDNPYGRSKKEGMRILRDWATRNNAPLTNMVIPNVFGDYGRPFYNSVVATFCHQLTHNDRPKIKVDGRLSLIYVNELTEIITEKILNRPTGIDTLNVQPTATAKVTEILALLENFKDSYYNKKTVPELQNDFQRNLYNTFLTYMDVADFQQFPKLHSDDRGSLFEVVKQADAGLVFFSTTKPGITRGNHYHSRKMEKFCVVRGEAIIRIRRIGTDKVVEYKVSGVSPCSIEMPIFHTHNITNVGDMELLTLFWTNELFNPDDPDTFYMEV